MLTTVKASAPSGYYASSADIPVLTIPMSAISAEPVQIRDIQGLGPVKAAIASTQNGSQNGEIYLGSSLPKRNIVLTLGLNPSWTTQTIASLREMLYGFFMPQRQVELTFIDSVRQTVHIFGYVESCEPNIFSKEPEMQVSVICLDPDFIAVAPSSGSGVVQSDYSGLININYPVSAVPTGVLMEVLSAPARAAYTGTFSFVNLSGLPQQDNIAVGSTTVVDATKKLRLSSRPGSKYVNTVAVPSGVQTNNMGQVTGSQWPTIRPGLNKLGVSGAGTGQTFTYEYYARYGGL